MAKVFDSFEDMDKFALEMRLMKTQMNVLKQQTQFNKILALATTILAFTAFLSFMNNDFTNLLYFEEEFNWIGLIVAILFAGLFIWLIVEITNELLLVKNLKRKRKS